MKFSTIIFLLTVFAYSVHGQSGATVPFDLPKFQPILSESRLHSRSTSPATVRAGRFEGYQLPERFHLGEDGTTMVLGTTRSDRDRSELRHNSVWPVTETEMHYSARMRFDKPVPEGDGWKRRRLHIVQVYVPGIPLGPVVLINWRPTENGKDDHLWFWAQRGSTHDLGPRPNDFFDLDVTVRNGVVRVYIDGQLRGEDSIASFDGRRAFFKTGAYHRGIEPHAVEFESLSITEGIGEIGRGAANPTAATITAANALSGTPYYAIIGDNPTDPYFRLLTFEKVSGPPWLNVAANGEISGTPFSRDVGPNSFEVKVSNTEGDSIRITLQVTVE